MRTASRVASSGALLRNLPHYLPEHLEKWRTVPGSITNKLQAFERRWGKVTRSESVFLRSLSVLEKFEEELEIKMHGDILMARITNGIKVLIPKLTLVEDCEDTQPFFRVIESWCIWPTKMLEELHHSGLRQIQVGRGEACHSYNSDNAFARWVFR